MMQQSIAGVYIIRDGELVYVNPRLAGIFGYAKESAVMERRVEDLVAQS
jgi:PAS domain S-box-containing protein